jgi:hypothetical protein
MWLSKAPPTHPTGGYRFYRMTRKYWHWSLSKSIHTPYVTVNSPTYIGEKQSHGGYRKPPKSSEIQVIHGNMK